MRKNTFKVVVTLLAVLMLILGLSSQAYAASATSRVQDLISNARSGINTIGKGGNVKGQAIVMFKPNSSALSPNAARAKLRGNTGSLRRLAGKYAVKSTLSFTTKAPDAAAARRLQAQTGRSRTAVPLTTSRTTVALVTSSSLSSKSLVAALKKNPNVAYAEPNYKIKISSVTNDPYSDKQWSMQDSAADVSYQWNTAQTTSSKKIVAVVDTGVDYTHEDLKYTMWENNQYPALKGEHGYDFVNNDGDPLDDNGHGTHCSGIIAAQGDNGLGVSGVVKKGVTIMALKIFGSDGESDSWSAIRAYNYIDKALDLGEPIAAINDSWGGEEDSAILEQVINVVGAKGATSICSAGNEGANNDEEATFPANIDSPYVVSVAAVNKDGKLASYSNYGAATVDLAAPGTDILSSVSYPCFNPSIYSSQKRDQLAAQYYSYDAAPVKQREITATTPSADGVPGELTALSLTSEATSTMAAQCVIENAQGFEGEGNALKISFKNVPAGSINLVRLPYKLASTAPTEAPHFSAMIRAKATNPEGGAGLIFDAPANQNITSKSLDSLSPLTAEFDSNDPDYWSHVDYPCLQDPEKAEGQFTQERYIYMGVVSITAGNYEVTLDDMALSKDGIAPAELGKYDYMSGTSMAAPYVTGAYVLKSEKLGSGATTLRKINTTISSVKRNEALPVKKQGSFDFSQTPSQLAPMIKDVKVNTTAKTISISGDSLLGASVNINGTPATVVAQTDGLVTVSNAGWINNVGTIKVTNPAGVDAKKDVYFVQGKKPHTILYSDPTETNQTDVLDTDTNVGAVVSDGSHIFVVSPLTTAIMKTTVTDYQYGGSDALEPLSMLRPEQFFDTSHKTLGASYGLKLSNTMAYANGRLYVVAGYGQLSEGAASDDGGIGSVGASADDGDDIIDGTPSLATTLSDDFYSAEYKLISIDTKTGKTRVEKGLPTSLKKRADWAMAAYNGSIYFLGGYSFDSANRGLSKKVNVYNPSKKSWSYAPDLPSARGLGHAIQSGSKLIYALGYNANDTCPAPVVLSKGKWSAAAPGLDAYASSLDAQRGGKTYKIYEGVIGACKVGSNAGIAITGTQVKNYGDTFTYDATTHAYKDMGYALATAQGVERVAGTAVGGRLFTLNGHGTAFSASISSASVKMTTSKKGKGTISKSKTCVPGTKVTFTAKASKGYYVKSIKVGSKTYTYSKKAKAKTKTRTISNALTSNVTVKAVFAKK